MDKDLLKDRLDTAARIRFIREKAGLTQEAFAEILGISLSGYKKIENAENQISLNGLRKLNRKLQVTTDYILLGDNVQSDTLWNQIMNCSDSDKMFLMLKLLLYFTQNKDNIFYLKDEQAHIDKAILHVMEDLKKYSKN
ncbi:MAG: helix-turn-helix transcriptional regulator [Lachnospiraceae bacterium]|nr:helix-turn-helix transcriptional regulator [Lachnospiraceae bacterium]